ncbi:hypothetical protein ROLI_014320 [Roseobacter fucihabitans]|uniref:Uncharacterized protein n=1 Tax=Roseobacter fucihabitans TaxID=1537242 RepID=A0ABZ2BQS7_9RHOB|nr:hypothetical protein [Roseobacter litoralis]MBC6968306.1 hypothetical protein [Roseobacter litoralis]
MIGSVSLNTTSMPRPAEVAKQAEQPKPKQEFKVELPLGVKKDVSDSTSSPASDATPETGRSMQEYYERKLQSENRWLEAKTRQKQDMKEWAERIPGQIGEVREQISTAGPDAIGGLTDRLASLNSTLISVSKNYAEIVEGWDEFVAEKNDNIAKWSAQLDARAGDSA